MLIWRAGFIELAGRELVISIINVLASLFPAAPPIGSRGRRVQTQTRVSPVWSGRRRAQSAGSSKMMDRDSATRDSGARSVCPLPVRR